MSYDKRIVQLVKQTKQIIMGNMQNRMNIGLFSGQMGHVIYLYQAGRLLKCDDSNQAANELFDSVISKITIDYPVDFKNGLNGVGLSIRYLISC